MDSFTHLYMQRLQLAGSFAPDESSLRQIHKHHLLQIPFENLDIMNGRRLVLEEQKLWEKIVRHKRGGICYELNGLLGDLLRRLGYQADLLAAQVMEENGDPFDHALLLVCCGEDRWLADVGFGDHFLEPLQLVENEVQRDRNGWFRLEQAAGEEYRLWRSRDGHEYTLEYTFTLRPRQLEEFQERCGYYELSPDSRFRRNRLCSLETETGRITLTEEKLVVTDAEGRQEWPVTDGAEYERLLRERFGIAADA